MIQRLTFLVSLVAFVATSGLAQRNADCVAAFEICKKGVYQFASPRGIGNDKIEADMMSCFMRGDNMGQAEENSTWIKFEVAENGNLNFTITPYEPSDDIDFVVFRLPADGNCARKQVVRCMAAGDPEVLVGSSPCLGQTGLRDGETDSSEDAGCSDPGDNAWLAPLGVVKGEKYVLLVSNVTAPRGWSISFGGTCKLMCEKKEEKKPPIAAAKPKKPETPKPTPPKPNPTPPAPPKDPKPAEIKGRKVEVGETVRIKSRTIKIKIWDGQVEDGDIVSVYLDDKLVLSKHYLRLKPYEFELKIPVTGNEHYITLYADDFGKAEPNTATISINDGQSVQTIDLKAGRNKQESIKLKIE
jgi:hypothetical protein